jgi:hypothetical protein
MSGLAVMLAGEFVFWLESDDPVVLMDVITAEAQSGPVQVILENILGSGPRDHYIQRTIEILGYIDNSCRGLGIPCERVPQQARLANVKNVPAYIHGKDERAAAAHVLSYRERKRSVTTRTKHHRRTQRRNGPSAISNAG